MPAHRRSKNGVRKNAYVVAINAFFVVSAKAWMAGYL